MSADQNDTTTLAQATGAEVATGTTAEAAAPAPINAFVNMVKTPFHFKTDKDTKDETTGAVIAKGAKHPSVDIYLPIPTVQRLQEFLAAPEQYGKEVELLLSAVSGIVTGVARSQITEFRENDKSAVVTPAVVNYDKLDFTAIANMPKSERASTVPAEEDQKLFFASYLELMPAITNKDAAKIKNHIDIMATGFKKQRAQKEMLEFFVEALAMYATNVPQETVEEHEEVITYLSNRLERMLKVDTVVTMEDL